MQYVKGKQKKHITPFPKHSFSLNIPTLKIYNMHNTHVNILTFLFIYNIH